MRETSRTGLGGSPGALVTADLLIPFATLAVLAFVLAGLVMPGRDQVVAVLVAFLTASAGAMMRVNDVLNGDYSIYPACQWVRDFGSSPAPSRRARSSH
jgi:hypothetical protein